MIGCAVGKLIRSFNFFENLLGYRLQTTIFTVFSIVFSYSLRSVDLFITRETMIFVSKEMVFTHFSFVFTHCICTA